MTITDAELRIMEEELETLQRELQRLEALEDQRLRDAGMTREDLRQPLNVPPELAAALEKAQAAADAAGDDAATRHTSGLAGGESDLEKKIARGRRRMKTV